MEPKKYEQLRKEINYINEEFLHQENKQVMIFENADMAIAAIRNNEIPGVKWTEECERKYQRDLELEKIFEES